MEANTTEPVPYNGEESELRDVVADMFDTNSTQIVISDVLTNIFNNNKLVTDQDDAEMLKQVRMELYQI